MGGEGRNAMTYATEQDMITAVGERELIQLTDRDGSTGAIVTPVLNAALEDADATINSYLESGGYAVPLDPVPRLILRIAVDLARYRLHDDTPAGDEEPWVRRYHEAIRMLGAIRDGKISLGLPADGAGRPDYSAPGRVFTRHDLEDF